MYCVHCRAVLSEGDSFCVSCGKPQNSQQTAAAPIAPAAPAYTQSVYYPPIERAPSNAIAIVGMVMGIVGIPAYFLVGIPAVVGLILSIIGLVKSNSHPLRPKRGIAIAGLITSIVGVVIYAIVWIVIIFYIMESSSTYYNPYDWA